GGWGAGGERRDENWGGNVQPPAAGGKTIQWGPAGPRHNRWLAVGKEANHCLCRMRHARLHPQIGQEFVQKREANAIGLRIEFFYFLGEATEEYGQHRIGALGQNSEVFQPSAEILPQLPVNLNR